MLPGRLCSMPERILFVALARTRFTFLTPFTNDLNNLWLSFLNLKRRAMTATSLLGLLIRCWEYKTHMEHPGATRALRDFMTGANRFDHSLSASLPEKHICQPNTNLKRFVRPSRFLTYCGLSGNPTCHLRELRLAWAKGVEYSIFCVSSALGPFIFILLQTGRAQIDGLLTTP